jgi:hypothetical protein
MPSELFMFRQAISTIALSALLISTASRAFADVPAAPASDAADVATPVHGAVEPAQAAPPANDDLQVRRDPSASTSSNGLGTELSVMAGLTQWVVFRGGNIAGELKVGRLAFEVSHGQGLDLNQIPSLGLSSAERSAGVHILVPWTTGGGVGVRITRNLHILLEVKAHHYVVTGADPTQQVKYTTFSVGPGVFYTFHIYKGLFLEPNVRYWPNVGSTLKNNEVDIKGPDGSTYVHQAHDFGLFANMNVGWTF